MTQFLAEEFRNAFSADHIIMFVRLIGAAIFGGLIGFEREIHRHPAGLRTHILVSMAAALFVLVAIEVPEIMRSDRDVLRVDPTRVVQSITEGVAFLAAGIVFLQKGTVKGLTTGAGLWFSGAIGLTIGLGLWSLGIFASMLGLVVLFVLRRLEINTNLSRRKSLADEAEE